jgi:hypothetical protein
MSDPIPVVYASGDASVVLHGGGQVMVRKGQHWAAADPLVSQYPHLFSPDPRYGMQYTTVPEGFDAAPVETATAAPGETRPATRGGRRV